MNGIQRYYRRELRGWEGHVRAIIEMMQRRGMKIPQVDVPDLTPLLASDAEISYSKFNSLSGKLRQQLDKLRRSSARQFKPDKVKTDDSWIYLEEDESEPELFTDYDYGDPALEPELEELDCSKRWLTMYDCGVSHLEYERR